MRWIREHKVFSTVVAIVAALIAVILISFSSGGGSSIIGDSLRSAVNTIEKPFVSIASGISENVKGIFSYKSLKEENEALKAENEKLQKENSDLSIKNSEYLQLQELSKAFDFEPFEGTEEAVAANIIAVDNSMIYKEFTVDVGENKGIEEGDIVVDGNGLVGEVTEVSKNSSKVKSILNESKNISFMIKGQPDILGVLHGNGNTVLSGYLIDTSANASEGDILVTSGIGHFPKGIVIGRIDEVEIDSDTQLKMVTVKPTAKLQSMQKVAIFK